MSGRIRYAGSALADIEQIWQYLAASNIATADRWVDHIDETLKCVIGEHPQSGRTRAELGDRIRSYPIVPYVVFYRVDGKTVRCASCTATAIYVRRSCRC